VAVVGLVGNPNFSDILKYVYQETTIDTLHIVLYNISSRLAQLHQMAEKGSFGLYLSGTDWPLGLTSRRLTCHYIYIVRIPLFQQRANNRPLLR